MTLTRPCTASANALWPLLHPGETPILDYKNDGIEFFSSVWLVPCSCLSVLSPCLPCLFLFQEPLSTVDLMGHVGVRFSADHDSVQTLLCTMGSLKLQNLLAAG